MQRLFADDAARLAAFAKNGTTLVGDVDPSAMRELSSAYTPVPGGVGPLTIAMLMANTVQLAEQHLALDHVDVEGRPDRRLCERKIICCFGTRNAAGASSFTQINSATQFSSKAAKPMRRLCRRSARIFCSADGSIDRKKLAATVFGSPELLAKLSSFVHPAVFKLEQQMFDAWEAQHSDGIAVVEAAILIETGRHTAYDRIILAACDPETQIARGMKRDRLTREEVLARLSRQMPLAEKKKYAHYIVDTDGAKEDTIRQVDDVFRDLKQLAEGAQA